jgi:acetyl esterase/lipase
VAPETPSEVPSRTPSSTTTSFPFSEQPIAIEPGSYRIARSAWSVADFAVTFPDGWQAQYGHDYLKHADAADEFGFYAVVVDAIFADACEGSEGALMEVGPTVADLATALVQQQGPEAREPVEVTLGGYPATRVDLTVPAGLDLTGCNVPDIGLQVWYSPPANKNFVLLRDGTASVYIVDIDGQRQVFLTQFRSGATDEDLHELRAVLDSIQIEPVGPSATTDAAPTATPSEEPVGAATHYTDLAYGEARPGNLLDLYVPDVPGNDSIPLLIWHSGSAWFANDVKDFGDDATVIDEFTSRGYAVASINIRSSSDARFPAQGFDVRAAIRYLRENAPAYGIDPDHFAFMGDSSGGWASAFAATTSDILELEGETAVDGTSSAVQVAVAFFPPTDFLSIDAWTKQHNLPMGDAYPHDAPTSAEGILVHCPTEGPSVGPPDPDLLVSIQDCPEETEKADPASYIDGAEVPIWLLHGMADDLVGFGQSSNVYYATTVEGNLGRLSLVPGAGHSVDDIIGAQEATTWVRDRGYQEKMTVGQAPTWAEIEQFIASAFF